jgi:hypothetical protein
MLNNALAGTRTRGLFLRRNCSIQLSYEGNYFPSRKPSKDKDWPGGN